MCENFFEVENLTVVKKRFALDTLPTPFVKICCEGGSSGYFFQNQAVAHVKLAIFSLFSIAYNDL